MTRLCWRSRGTTVLAAWLMLYSTTPMTAMASQEGQAGGLKITIIEGDNAIVNVRQRVSREAIIQVEDENRKPVGGALVTLLAPNDGASATFGNGARTITVTTDGQGRVSVKNITPNQVAGSYQIRVVASKNGLRGTAVLSSTNVVAAGAAASAGGISAKMWAIIAGIGAAAAVGTIVAVSGGGSSSSPSTPPGPTPIVLTPGQPTVGPPR